MPIAAKFFSFEGRLRRQDLWLCTLVLIVVVGVLKSVVAVMFGPMVLLSADYSPMRWAAMSGMSGGFGVVALVLLWPTLAIGVKRCHDRNKSGLWMVLAFIPVIGWIWWLVELGLLDGTPGPNSYGPSPKGVGHEPVAS